MTTNETISNINEMTTKAVDRMSSLGDLNVRMFEKMSAIQMDTMSLYMEHAMRVMKLAAESKGYNELMRGQVEAAKELSERVLAEGKAGMQVVSEMRDDYRAWVEKSMSDLSADLRKGVQAA